jgi:DNA-binding NarL/FixJ family response regulator
LSTSKPISVVLARFDDLLAVGLQELLKRDAGIETVAADVAGDRLAAVVRGHRANVAIVNGDALASPAELREIRARNPQTSLVLLLHAPSEAECAELLAFGADACLDTGAQGRDVLNAVHLASRGLRVTAAPLSPAGPGDGRRGVSLTQRESEVLPLLREGRSNAEIALSLNVGVETIRTHTRSIYKKLGVSSRRELIAPPRPRPVEQPRPSMPPRRRRSSAMAGSRRRGGHNSRPR